MGYGMSYGRMQGDPFLGGLIKGAFKIGKGIVGAGLRGAGILPPAMPTMPSMPQVPQIAMPGTGLPRYQGPLVNAQRGARGPGTQVTPGIQSPMPGPGYRPNKSSYFLRDGTFVPAGSKWVKARRRNPANARALRRALSRAESFGGIVKRVRKTTRRLKTI